MRNKTTFASLVVAYSASLFLAAPAQAAGNLVFDINYTDECQETSPNNANYGVKQHVVVTLHDGNRVTEQRSWQSPKTTGGLASEGAMGSEVTAGRIAIAWHVQSQNSLIRYRTFPQHVETMHISVSGQTCEVAIEHKLKPGFNAYERFGNHWEPHFFSSLVSTGITCSVTPQ